MRVPFILLLFYFFLNPLHSQEFATGLVKNKIVEEASHTQRFALKRAYSQNDTLQLPFFDDFASTTVFPDQHLWTDSFVYINSQYPVNPPTIGIATFDALDQKGALYSNASYSSFLADKLTSKYINLDYSADSNIYLSFFYQPKGLGHMPRTTDSLMLQFFAPNQNTWKRIWGIPGDSLRPFKQIIIPIKDTAFLTKAFRFRFMNYASISQSIDDHGKEGDNSDWNIDYVYLNKGRNSHDTLLNDLAILTPLPSLLSYFEAIPWRHFPFASDELMASGKTSVYYRYYSPILNKLLSLDYYLTIKSSNPTYSYVMNNTDNIVSGITYFRESYYDKLNYVAQDSAIYQVSFFLHQEGVNSNKSYMWNDTIRREQVFKDYYAYDDGSAENGYGLLGQGTKNARVADQFVSYMADSLRAIDIYFNDVFKDANAKYFDLTVWDSNNGFPNNILFSKADTTFFPVFKSRNHFIRYILDKPIAITDTFYIGWIQTTGGFLNVGLDLNNITYQKKYFNINGTWQISSISGSLMMRPVFGNSIAKGIGTKQVARSARLFPNPASEQLNIELENSDNSNLKVSFYDLSGKLVLSEITYGEPLNISSLENGMYVVRIDSPQSAPIFKKLRVIR